ncbi:MAG: hypothetical protein HY905_10980 [Deltaproteobacteria bacterium]|nr:hypothetical protein [Deltaproteobacteria bacterium]
MRIPRSLLVVGAVVLAAAGACVGGSMSITQRFASVHNVLAPAGFGQLGPISEGELGQGESADVDLPLSANQCYSVTAFGDQGVWDLDAEILDPDGTPVASDAARGPQASVYYCAQRSGRHVMRVTASSGAGAYAVGLWAASEAGAGIFSGGGGGGGTCDAPVPLELGATVRGSTQGGNDNITPSCVQPGDSSAPDAVYEVTIEQAGMLRANLQTQYDGVLSLLVECVGDPGAAIACNDDLVEQDTTRSGFEVAVEPGTYYLVVDGYAAEAGGFSLSTEFEVQRDMGEVCAELPLLAAGETVEGTTADQGDDFRTDQECAGGSRAPDVGYRLELTERSRVRLSLASQYDGALAIRRECAVASSVVACNDDFGESDPPRASQIVTALDPGTYTVIVDGYEGERGRFELTATVVPVGQASAPNDACSGAIALEPGETAEADTFQADDDTRGSCIQEPGAPDVVYEVRVAERSLLVAEATGGDLVAPVLYLQRTCGDAESEIACGDRRVSAVLDPGTYYLIADGATRDAMGSLNLSYTLSDVAPLDAVCSDAPVLAAGETTHARTSGQDRFQGPCGEGSRGPESVFSLRVRERSRVELSVEAEFDSVLYVRSDCVDPGTTVDCNDDAGDSNHSLLDLELDPGTYYVFVDGYGEGSESGPFTIRAEVTPR